MRLLHRSYRICRGDRNKYLGWRWRSKTIDSGTSNDEDRRILGGGNISVMNRGIPILTGGQIGRSFI